MARNGAAGVGSQLPVSAGGSCWITMVSEPSLPPAQARRPVADGVPVDRVGDQVEVGQRAPEVTGLPVGHLPGWVIDRAQAQVVQVVVERVEGERPSAAQVVLGDRGGSYVASGYD
jgi:hypothetical protein